MVGFCECFTKWILQKKLKYVCFCKGNLLDCKPGLSGIIVRTKWRFSCASGDTARAEWKGNCFFGDGKFSRGKPYWTYAVRFIWQVTTKFIFHHCAEKRKKRHGKKRRALRQNRYAVFRRFCFLRQNCKPQRKICKHSEKFANATQNSQTQRN